MFKRFREDVKLRHLEKCCRCQDLVPYPQAVHTAALAGCGQRPDAHEGSHWQVTSAHLRVDFRNSLLILGAFEGVKVTNTGYLRWISHDFTPLTLFRCCFRVLRTGWEATESLAPLWLEPGQFPVYQAGFNRCLEVVFDPKRLILGL